MNSQLPNRQGRAVRTLLKTLPGSFERQQQRVRRADRIIVWLVGLSVAAIGFIISQSGTNLQDVGGSAEAWSVGLFVGTILSGLLGRIAALFLEWRQSEARDRIMGYLRAYRGGGSELPPVEEATSQQMRSVLREVAPNRHAEFRQASDAEVAEVYERFRADYNALDRQASRDLMKRVLAEQGADPGQVDGMFQMDDEGISRDWATAATVLFTNVLFFVSVVSFMGGVLVVSLTFLGS